MKTFLTLATLSFASFNLSANEVVECSANSTIQRDIPHLQTKAKLRFSLERKGPQSKISNVQGHIFVHAVYALEEEMSTDNSYMGFFQFNQLAANPHYRPLTYKGWVQFKEFNAHETQGLETGMWGNLVLNLSSGKNFEARYIFQAGDHMGGTVLFNCQAL